MIAVHAKWFPHTTAKDMMSHGDQDGIDLFDGESVNGHNFVEVYIRFVDGKRWPARTINMTEHPESAKRILAAWSNKGKVNDYRKSS